MGKRSQPPTPVAGLIDSHCHLDYAPLSDDLGATLDRAHEAGVEQFVHIGCSVDRLEPAIALTQRDPRIFASVGIHPHNAVEYSDEIEQRLRTYAGLDAVVAIGETGLDYHYDRSPREVQQAAMARQMSLAHELDMPVVLHIREAHRDGYEIIDAGPKRDRPGIVHCFTGGPEEARQWLDRGFHLSFSGIATFKTAAQVAEAAKLCPADRILLETDAPYLAPVPMRGRKNEPAYVAFTCAFLAEARGETPQDLAKRAAHNTRELLGLPLPGVRRLSASPAAAPAESSP